jgi:CRP-like cAMP-binding protein
MRKQTAAARTAASDTSLSECEEARPQALRQPNLLAELGTSDRQLVLSLARRRHVDPGGVVFGHGDLHDAIYLIESGLVRTFYSSPSGREITLAYWTAGNLVGAPQVFGGGTYLWSCKAVSRTDLLVLRGADVRALVERSPQMAVGLIEALAFKVRWLSGLVQVLGTQSVTGRLAFLLETLSDLHGVCESGGIAIDMPFTHEDLANMVGASRQWVTTALDRFQQQGIVRIRKRHLVIIRRDLLRGLIS